MQAGGHRFDPDRLHHFLPLAVGSRQQRYSRNEDNSSRFRAGFKRSFGSVHRHFDIVNGFFNRCRAGSVDEKQAGNCLLIIDQINASNIWLRKKTIIRIIATLNAIPTAGISGLSLVVWTLKCEVRAFGECLGMQRR